MPFTAFNDYVTLLGDRAGAVRSPQPESPNSDYESGVVEIDGEVWRIRTARLTPKKPGAFVACWQRAETGETTPFDTNDGTAGLLVFVREAPHFGVFCFTAGELERLGITKSATQSGKRGFRVYPGWCVGLNAQAMKTQRAQVESFETLQ